MPKKTEMQKRIAKAEAEANLDAEDIREVAKNVHQKTMTDEQVAQVLEEYPEEQELDPTGGWDLVVNNILHSVFNS